MSITVLRDLHRHAQEPGGFQIGTGGGGVTQGVRGDFARQPASPTADLILFFTDATGLLLNSTKQIAISLRSRLRRR
jgi:hypothetical protein